MLTDISLQTSLILPAQELWRQSQQIVHFYAFKNPLKENVTGKTFPII